ncbi:type I restriction-modification system specificity subunit [Microscilla marina ATCC 23134]|uniref:Type I restriction-modification system specificity subunit n=1 Tax=Microscilla marina ATCC 23134 TaxID=313606 RepID=A2A0M9_MICM2|nr:type I restriction-modification system specificity subunit [Microscilla marina ATCC 23134]
MLSELDAGIASLKKAETQLKTYRQAVLKKAFEGELTKGWRAQQSDLPTAEALLEQIKEERAQHHAQQLADWAQAVKAWEAKGKEGKKPAKPKKPKEVAPLSEEELKQLPNLPEGWGWMKMGNLVKKIQIGPFGSQLHKHDYVEQGIPIINPKHIKDGYIFPSECITKAKVDSLPQYILNMNDIILGRRGEMGRAALISSKENGWFCGTGSLYIRFTNFFEAKLYALILGERRVIHYLEKKGSGTTMTNLNLGILNNLPIQVIPLPEQHQIVQEIESRLSVCDQVEASIQTGLAKAEALRQSILKKAFEGRLLSDAELATCKNEKDWAPASTLLAQIEAEKAEAEAKAPKKTPKRTKKKKSVK